MMEGGNSERRRWENLNIDILVKIYQFLNIIELTSGVAWVCSSWRKACHDPIHWRTVDLSMIKSNFIKISIEPYVYVSGKSDRTLMRILKISLSLSMQCIETLIMHFELYLSNEQLTYIAERCSRLRRLVLPAWNRVKIEGMCDAICKWSELESLTMPSIEDAYDILEGIEASCNNFRELKIMGPCNIYFASALAAFLPKLRVLSLRCTTLYKDALIHILDNVEDLEVLNISHCIIIDPTRQGQIIMNEIDESILEKTSRLREFITCMDDSCIM